MAPHRPTIYQARDRRQQFEQIPTLQGDFTSLDRAISRFSRLARPNTGDQVEPAYVKFVCLLSSRESPTWRDVHRALEQVFGVYPNIPKQRVPAGRYGIAAVRELIARAVSLRDSPGRDDDDDDDDDIGEAKLWLYKLARSVDHTANQLELAGAAPDRGLNPRATSTPSQPAIPSSPELEPGPITHSPAKRPRQGGGAAPSPSPPRPRKRSATGERRSEPRPPPRRVERSTPKRNDHGRLNARNYSEDEDELMMIGGSHPTTGRAARVRATPERNLAEGTRTASLARNSSTTSRTPSPRPTTAEQLVRAVFTTIPSTTRLARDPTTTTFAPASAADVELEFKRTDIGGGLQVAIQAGTSDDVYHRDRNHLCIANASMNLCGHVVPVPDLAQSSPRGVEREGRYNLHHQYHRGGGSARGPPPPRPFEAGEPIVFVSSEDRCRELVEAISANPHKGKPKPFIHVWIQEPKGDKLWRYKGMYDVAHNGSSGSKMEYLAPTTTLSTPPPPPPLPLPGIEGGESESELDQVEIKRGGGGGGGGDVRDQVVRQLVRGHATPNSKRPDYGETILSDWDFSARDVESAIQELGTENEGTRERHLKYVALRNVGWDDESFQKWKRKRGERLASLAAKAF